MRNNPNLRIAAFWDGQNDGDSAYYLVQPDDNPYAWASYDESNHVSLGEMDSADPSTLVQFAAWAQSQYPGEYNFLTLVDHGNGWAPDLYPGQKGYKWTSLPDSLQIKRAVGLKLWLFNVNSAFHS